MKKNLSLIAVLIFVLSFGSLVFAQNSNMSNMNSAGTSNTGRSMGRRRHRRGRRRRGRRRGRRHGRRGAKKTGGNTNS